MALSDAGAAVMLNAFGAVAVWIGLNDGPAGTTGANELAGGSPAYARQQGLWNPASGKVIALGGAEEFDVPAGSTVDNFSLWNASSGGVFQAGGVLSSSEPYGAQGKYTLTGATVTLT
ncbi:hypothetical protein [Streptomyces halstedii]|uniref:hypothetical protein n=1 Tax=Streptomyces halstedii TaxID=1944 RepID=UPI00334C16F0